MKQHFQWIIPTVITVLLATCTAVYALGNQLYFPRSRGEVIEAKIENMDVMLAEVREDVKLLLRRGNR